MKKHTVIFLIIAIVLFGTSQSKAQSIEESCSLINSEVRDSVYSNFALSGTGFLTYTWSNGKGSETILSVEMSKIVFTTEQLGNDFRVWIKCSDGTNCISEVGILGTNENFNAHFNKTYIPARSVEGMNIIFDQLNFLHAMTFGEK